MPQISLEWDTVKSAFPQRNTNWVQAFMKQLGPGNTPCCVQMSHALSAAGCYIGPKSHRRSNSSITTPTGTRYYMLAVDEIKFFLTQNFGMGDEISTDDNGERRSTNEMKDILNGRTGILVFSNLHFGTHVELWDVVRMHQRDMSPSLFNAPKVLFWDVMIVAEA